MSPHASCAVAVISIPNKSLKIKWNWVKAHAGNPLNEEADSLAKKAANLD